MKYVRDTLFVRYSTGRALIEKGQSIADDHPLVLERPELFADVPPDTADIETPVHGVHAGSRPAVESATRAPGEVRRGRPRKSAE